MNTVKLKRIAGYLLSTALATMLASCGSESGSSEFTGNQMKMALIPGTVEGNTTTGTLLIRERTDGLAQLEITLNNVLTDAQHPVHLHFGSLDDDGKIATFLTTLHEVNGVGRSVTRPDRLDNDERLTYNHLLTFNGSIKIHFEASGPLENEILGAVNIGLNTAKNKAYLKGTKNITTCNNQYSR